MGVRMGMRPIVAGAGVVVSGIWASRICTHRSGTLLKPTRILGLTPKRRGPRWKGVVVPFVTVCGILD
jgi:hypothetical protein